MILICKNCHKKRDWKESNYKKGSFCSRKCYVGFKTLPPKILNCLFCSKEFRTYPSVIKSGKGIYCSLSCHAKDKFSGNKHWSWKGGVTPEHIKIRNSKDMLLWRVAVFMRDDYTCQSCTKKGGDLEADHIKPFSLYPELRFAIDNGQTLCLSCHREKTSSEGKLYWKNQYQTAKKVGGQ